MWNLQGVVKEDEQVKRGSEWRTAMCVPTSTCKCGEIYNPKRIIFGLQHGVYGSERANSKCILLKFHNILHQRKQVIYKMGAGKVTSLYNSGEITLLYLGGQDINNWNYVCEQLIYFKLCVWSSYA